MSLVESAATAVDCVHQRSGAADHQYHRLSSKRKLDDYGGPNFDDYDDDDQEEGDNAIFSDLVSVRMRKDELNAVNSSSDGSPCPFSAGTSQHLDSRVFDAQSASYGTSSSRPKSTRSPSSLQFFVRMLSEGYNLVIQADANDTVKSIHERIQAITGIPLFEQRLIYRGKQLQWEQSLAECSIQNDASLQLVGRMRSTEHPHAWQVIDDMISIICRLCKGEPYSNEPKDIKSCMSEYFSMTPKEENDSATSHLQIFMSSSAPAALVMLYVSPIKENKQHSEGAVKHFLGLIRNSLHKPLYNQCAPILLEFCKLLRRVGYEDPLYVSCRNALGSLLESVASSNSSHGSALPDNVKELIGVQEIFPFVSELSERLSRDLVSSVESTGVGPLLSDVRDFSAFLLPLNKAITQQVGSRGRISVLLDGRGYKHPLYGEEIEFLHRIFRQLLCRMDQCLLKMEDHLAGKGKGDGDIAHTRWSQYLAILKELNSISKLYEDAEERFWAVLRLRRSSFCALVVNYARRTDDNQWIVNHKDVLDFESRRHLAMMMFAEVKEDYEELHEMLIDRSHLLEESFEYIGRADPESLHGGLFMEFKNEEATGPGVLREWFFLVCQAIFNPQNALFVACPHDCRRFYPNPASVVDPLHLEYFAFAGRVIALALMHKVQVGIVFDRMFFQQLAGNSLISLEDICDADPCLYSSCKKILQMDAEFIDSDALGLTFAREIEELGARRVVELCPGGKSIVVNSKNRDEYVKLLIQHQFVKSISAQVSRFGQGFADMLCKPSDSSLNMFCKFRLQTSFFQGLELQDLDLMLHGSESAISVEDWKAHTEYNGYKENDSQIVWFWKIVEEMSTEQRKILLFFWTSVKYLPVEGFRGLASRLYIYRSSEPHDRLPSSHTCFYRLCFPPYSSMRMLQDRLRIITQEHFGSSFGTW
ncbi:E3 ubiquitin-protein ligase UPL5 [Morus notabilis]|uniref:E3 ubiquitin-protein ligase UPL5 n=1 Tax=Morus notabilis TaxID=981085 RepID=UPI000CED7F4D|nr:E3 ubiquitin-protein ligase UPL5 [Morus notabilis]XP_024017831.1 E3 ubiquitin-protein ligase UPL5 [Morus notabilis]XP_024017832.1 E3 ubiquitin-protein ligase UPL5 [Morus notabilis]XP_024017833.1 E3 ubiquitin-protein ligase UPL5 [Morus notabilis]